MTFKRFFATTILHVFDTIGKMDIKDHEKARRMRRAKNKLGGYSYKPNGEQECERRRRQIAAGSLRFENGLREE